MPVNCAPEDLTNRTDLGSPFTVYSFDAPVLVAVEEVRAWHDSMTWYRERGIPWTRGWMLYSAPGCGKTSLLRCIAQELDMPVVLCDLASMNNREFIESWESALAMSPCMIVFEDIDGVFNKRQNILGEQGGGLTFDCLLNCISGVGQSDGAFVAFTTNDITKVDAAIAQPANGDKTTRPGRVDRIIELGPMSEECRRRHAIRILDHLDPPDIALIVTEGEGMVAAQFNDLCVRRALKDYWNRKTKISDPDRDQRCAIARVDRDFGRTTGAVNGRASIGS